MGISEDVTCQDAAGSLDEASGSGVLGPAASPGQRGAMIRQVVVPWAQSWPRSSTSLASAVATLLPAWITWASHRTRWVRSVRARTSEIERSMVEREQYLALLDVVALREVDGFQFTGYLCAYRDGRESLNGADHVDVERHFLFDDRADGDRNRGLRRACVRALSSTGRAGGKRRNPY